MSLTRRSLLLPLVCLLLLWSWIDLGAVTPKEHYKKVVLRHVPPKQGTPPRMTDGLDAEIVHEYSESTTVYVHKNDVEELLRRASAASLESSVREDFDIIQLPNAHIDTRLGTEKSLPGKRLSVPGHAQDRGLYLLQFAGPVKGEWKESVASEGVKFIQYVPYNAYIVAARPPEIERTRALAFVQFVDVFHDVLKSQPVSREKDVMSDVLISLANVPDVQDVVKRLSRLSVVDLTTEVIGQDAEELRVRGTFDGADVDKIVDEDLVIAVSPFPEVVFSDERATSSLGPFVAADGTLNGPGGRYKSWLESVCPPCTTLETDGFHVGLADSGFWIGPQKASGQADPGPPDLPNTRVTYGKDFVADAQGTSVKTPTTFDDTTQTGGHGTFVASVMAGDPSSGVDSTGFMYGMGVAPSAGLVVTKINTSTAPGALTSVLLSAEDGRASGAFVQNHSYNQRVNQGYPSCTPASVDGKYSELSRDFDRAVRDSNDTGAGGGPITLVVSAGNQSQSGARPFCSEQSIRSLTSPPGTAKNVITVGGAETPRTASETWSCAHAGSSSLNNVEWDSKRGTVDGGWYKPDLMAPAANVAGLRFEEATQTMLCADVNSGATLPPSRYGVSTGTSFAAPIGSGAALLASRAYSSTAGAASPALLKAMLVMAARSMKGGKDHADRTRLGDPKDPVTTIGAIPSQSQGFGRISLEDILESYPARSYFNQAHSLPSGTAPNQNPVWAHTYSVHDATRPVTVVLTWTDAPAQVSVGAVITNPIVNDLDLSVYRGATCTERYIGNNLSSTTELSDPVSCTTATFDRKNNVEYIRFAGAPAGSSFTVNVRLETGTGPQDFALAIHNAYDSDDPAPPAVPSGVGAVGTSSSSVTVSWDGVAGATAYDVQRWDGGPFWKIVATGESGTSYNAASLNPMTSYLFKVRSRNATGVSGWSAADAATTFATGSSVLFTDDPLVAGVTAVKAQHLSELRQAVASLRVAAGLSAPAFTDPTLTPSVTPVKAVHLNELRTDLNAARQALGLSALTFTDPVLTSTVRAVHLQELRDAVK